MNSTPLVTANTPRAAASSFGTLGIFSNGIVFKVFFLLLAIAICAMAGDPPRVGRTVLASMEKNLDDRVSRLWDDNPFVLLGPTRGIYLEGYHVVFTVEINLATGPTMMMRPELSQD